MQSTASSTGATPLRRLAIASTTTCAKEASEYGKCVVATYTDVHKDKCKAEFEKFGACLRKTVSPTTLAYSHQLEFTEYTRADETQMVTLVVLPSIYRGTQEERETRERKPIKYTQGLRLSYADECTIYKYYLAILWWVHPTRHSPLPLPLSTLRFRIVATTAWRRWRLLPCPERALCLQEHT